MRNKSVHYHTLAPISFDKTSRICSNILRMIGFDCSNRTGELFIALQNTVLGFHRVIRRQDFSHWSSFALAFWQALRARGGTGTSRLASLVLIVLHWLAMNKLVIISGQESTPFEIGPLLPQKGENFVGCWFIGSSREYPSTSDHQCLNASFYKRIYQYNKRMNRIYINWPGILYFLLFINIDNTELTH